MKVYIVSSGEKHEGGSVYGVFSSNEKAREKALSIEPSFGPWEEIANDEWISGCDWLSIESWDVE